MHGGFYISEEAYKPIQDSLIQAIPASVPKDHRVSLENRIKYGYEYALKKRLRLILKSVLKDYKDIVDKLIGDQSDFVNKVGDTRNYLTHYTAELETAAVTRPPEQFALIQSMKILMQLCFLAELGLPVDIVKKSLVR